MKKFVSLILALALCLGLAAPALAVEEYGTFTIENADEWGNYSRFTFDKAFLVNLETEWEYTVPVLYVHPDSNVTMDCSYVSEEYYDNFLSYYYGGVVDGIPEFSILEGEGSPAGFGMEKGETVKAQTIFEDIESYGSRDGAIMIPALLSSELGYFIIIQDATKYGPNAGSSTTTTTTPTTGTTTGSTTTTPTTSTETSTTTTTPTTPTTTPVEGGVVYTVKQYDTMGKIALNYYGSYGYHLALYKANADAFAKTGGKLNTGMTLILPDTLADKARLAEPTLAEGESFYTVKAGDTLGAIAAATYGDIMMYVKIYERNADRLKNANTIFEGQVIVLPAK